MIAAGVNAKALSTYMGHAITLDKYGHLMPGNEEAAGLLDAYLTAPTRRHGWRR